MMIPGDNTNVLLNIYGGMVPASVDKVKPYQTSPRSNEKSSSLRGMDSVPDKLISGDLFLVSFRIGLAEA